MKNLIVYLVGTLLMSAAVAQAQMPVSGVMISKQGTPSYRASSPNWYFDAEVAYLSDGYVKEVSKMTFLPNRAVVRSWVDVRVVPQPISTKSPPTSIICYDARQQNIVWQSFGDSKTRVFRPSQASCLDILQRRIAAEGAEAVRRRYQIPASFPLTDYDGIRSGRVSGSGDPSTSTVAVANGMGINGMPSGHGWPKLMFRLKVFTPDALRAAGEFNVKKIGREKVAGFDCTKYRTSDGKTTVWVEPKTQIVLREEMYVQPPVPPGSRMPPQKPMLRGYVVRQFRTIKSAPDSLFSPPKDAIVELPELLYDMRLPAGITRRRYTGLYNRYGLPKLGVPLEFYR